MQVKKFEAPTLQEALDTVKRELGPEAIILQTKKYKRGFGLMSKGSVEVTAAVSDRSLQKKSLAETRLPEPTRESLKKLPAERQAEVYDKILDQHLKASVGAAQDKVQTRITATRYIDIEDEGSKAQAHAQAQSQARHRSAHPAPRKPASQAAHAAAAHAAHATSASSTAPAGATAAPFGAGMTMEEEVRHLKRMIEELKTAQDDGVGLMGAGAQVLMSQSRLATPALQDAFEQLVINGMDKRYALQLVRGAAFELGEDRALNPETVADQIAAEIMGSTEVSSPLAGITPGRTEGPVVVALVGPTGVGKTTTVAKMASEAILKRNLRVGLINLDTYKVAAFDQLGTYAKILNVPFRSAASAEDLRAAMADFHALDLVIVDTTGRSQRDPASLSEMHGMLQAIPNVRTELVLSVTTRDNELYDMANRFAIFRPQGLIVSKLDEGTIYGAIYNVCQRAKLPLLYFTTGQRVPEDIEEATRERVAALVLDL